MLADMLHHIDNKHEDTIGKYLKSTKRSKNIVRPMHSDDVHFVDKKIETDKEYAVQDIE